MLLINLPITPIFSVSQSQALGGYKPFSNQSRRHAGQACPLEAKVARGRPILGDFAQHVARSRQLAHNEVRWRRGSVVAAAADQM